MPPAPQTSQDALGQMQQFQQSMKSPTDVINGAQQSLGVPQAQQQVSGLRQAITNSTNLLNNVAPSVMGRTANSLVTSAQANRQIQNEQAPINQQLNKEQQDYAGANSDLTRLLGQADTQANAEIAGQNEKLGFLKNVYDALFGKEQAAAQAAQREREFNATQSLEQQKLAEQAREANLSANSGLNLASLFGGGTSSGNGAAKIAYKNGSNGAGGFNFTDSNGGAISAAKYAQLTGQDIASVLRQMANAGDTYAANAYVGLQRVGNNANARANVLKNFSALFWGV